MLGSDRLGGVEIRDGAGDFEDAAVRAGAQSHAADGHLERSLAGVIQGTELARATRWNFLLVIRLGTSQKAITRRLEAFGLSTMKTHARGQEIS